jgi:hypothetical protein
MEALYCMKRDECAVRKTRSSADVKLMVDVVCREKQQTRLHYKSASRR